MHTYLSTWAVDSLLLLTFRLLGFRVVFGLSLYFTYAVQSSALRAYIQVILLLLFSCLSLLAVFRRYCRWANGQSYCIVASLIV